MYILLPETDNCPTWISGWDRMTVENKQGSDPWSPDHQSHMHTTEPSMPAWERKKNGQIKGIISRPMLIISYTLQQVKPNVYMCTNFQNPRSYLFVLKFYGPVKPMGSCRARSVLPNHIFTGQAKSSKWLTSIVCSLSPETDNCPSWISGRERMTVENISWSTSTKECCRPRWGLNLRPPGLQLDGASNWATEAGRHNMLLNCGCIQNLKTLALIVGEKSVMDFYK